MQDSEELTGVAAWAVDLMEALGGPGAGLLIAVENVFPPIPSEVVLPLAGFTASRGTFTLFEAVFWTTLGSVVGAVVLFQAGRTLGPQRLRSLWDRLPLTRLDDLDRTEAWFTRHGRKAVFFGRMVPIFRSLVSVPAGLHGMGLPTFLLLTTAGSLVWNTTFVVAGYVLGEQWHRIEDYAGVFQLLVVALVVAAVGHGVVRRVRAVRAGGGAGGAEAS